MFKRLIFSLETNKRSNGHTEQYCLVLQGEELVIRAQRAKGTHSLIKWKDTHGLQRCCEGSEDKCLLAEIFQAVLWVKESLPFGETSKSMRRLCD